MALKGNAAPAATILIRVMVGAVFLAEGIQKFLYYGLWGFAHESRTDFSMLMGSLFLLFAGPGPFSLDARRSRRR